MGCIALYVLHRCCCSAEQFLCSYDSLSALSASLMVVVNLNGTSTVVPQCGGSVQDNCWEQTSGAPGVSITGYKVTSSKFPCTSGTTQTILSWNNQDAWVSGSCPVYCDGFGCSDGKVESCGADFGMNCPAGPGQYETTGKTGECKSGLGSYTVTIECPAFTLVTYLTY